MKSIILQSENPPSFSTRGDEDPHLTVQERLVGAYATFVTSAPNRVFPAALQATTEAEAASPAAGMSFLLSRSQSMAVLRSRLHSIAGLTSALERQYSFAADLPATAAKSTSGRLRSSSSSSTLRQPLQLQLELSCYPSCHASASYLLSDHSCVSRPSIHGVCNSGFPSTYLSPDAVGEGQSLEGGPPQGGGTTRMALRTAKSNRSGAGANQKNGYERQTLLTPQNSEEFLNLALPLSRAKDEEIRSALSPENNEIPLTTEGPSNTEYARQRHKYKNI